MVFERELLKLGYTYKVIKDSLWGMDVTKIFKDDILIGEYCYGYYTFKNQDEPRKKVNSILEVLNILKEKL